MRALINYFLVLGFVGATTASAQNPIDDPVTMDPPPAPLPEPTIPVAMPEPALPAQGPEEAVVPSALIPMGETAEFPRVERHFWECQLSTGSFAVGIPDIVTVSLHEYVIDDKASVYEATITTRSALVARFYFLTALPAKARPMASPLLEGRHALERARTLIASGRHLQRVEEDHGLPIKRAEDVALAPTVEYRLETKADVLALYQSALDAWKNDNNGLFRLTKS